MDLIPVIDLMQGQVIRGHAGKRETYQPNVSQLVSSADPLLTCAALIRNFRPHLIYVADLDGIQEGRVQLELLKQLVGCGVGLAVDAGTTSLEQAHRLMDLGVQKVIIGLETLSNLELMSDFVLELGADRILFSLDLLDGEPLGPDVAKMTAMEVVDVAIESGVRQLIVLDLAMIGTNRGVPTGSLCHAIKNRWADLVVWTGGGVRSLVDLHKLSLCRVDSVMVASALHDGHITPSDWQSFEALSNDTTQLAMDA